MDAYPVVDLAEFPVGQEMDEPSPPDVETASVVEQVAGVACAMPDAIALVAGAARLDYGTLDARANRLARHLGALGVGPDVPVGVALERSFARVVATLAVLKAGGAFLPLDPNWPEARQRLVLDDARAPVVIVDADREAALADGRHGVVLDRDEAVIERHAATPPDIDVDDAALAYVIYTSGSTGEPKGVEITRANLRHLVRWHRQAFGVTAFDRAGHVAGLGFDAAVWEIWPYLCAGASVALPSERVRGSASLLHGWLIDEAITIAFVPTPLAEPLIATTWPADTALRLLLTGGDTLHEYPRPGLPFAVVNNYGPTECTVVATSG